MGEVQLRRPIWLGVLLAPLCGPMALQLFVLLVTAPDGLADAPAVIFLYSMIGLPIAYSAMLMLGLPYLLWLRKTGRLGWLTVCAGAAFAGSVSLPAGAVLIIGRLADPFGAALGGGVLGLISGIFFCLITGVGPLNARTSAPGPVPARPET